MNKEICLDHKQWAEHLRRAHCVNTRTKRGIRLPKQDRIHFSGSCRLLKIHLDHTAVQGNMQSDGAAFEAWTLAFHFWCGVERVEIAWDIPAADPKHPLGNPHYNRFLYRVDRFCDMFPTLASVGEGNRAALAASITRTAGRLVLNRPSKPRDGNVKNNPEAMLEGLLFEGKIPLPSLLPSLDLDRQLPVGLFLNKKAAGNGVFTAKASAIDLWGVDGDTAWLFELKAAGNCKMGIVSELVFYANLIRDAISPEMPTFAFEKECALSRCRRIVACFLVQEGGKGAGPLHPLLEADANGRCVFQLLNKALPFAGIPVDYRCAVLGRETLEVTQQAGSPG